MINPLPPSQVPTRASGGVVSRLVPSCDTTPLTPLVQPCAFCAKEPPEHFACRADVHPCACAAAGHPGWGDGHPPEPSESVLDAQERFARGWFNSETEDYFDAPAGCEVVSFDDEYDSRDRVLPEGAVRS